MIQKKQVSTLITMLLVIVTNVLKAQEQTSEIATLKSDIIKMDSLLFQVAFNQCDLKLFKSILTSDIEFYDDRSGLNTSMENEIASFKDKCSKPYIVTRQLTDSFIDKLGDFGAVQTGEHQFYVDEKPVEKAKFVTIWARTEDAWVVKRAISYSHTSLAE